MSSSVLNLRRRVTTKKPLIGFVVGRYIAFYPDRSLDYNGINANIEAVLPWAIKLWEEGFLVFVPHLNTHHFQEKTRIDPDPLENEEYYRAFDRKLLGKGIDFIFATPNWRQSTGGRLEIQLAVSLGIPVFESIADVVSWAEGRQDYSRVIYDHISEAALHFGEGKDLKIALVDGPFWATKDGQPDLLTIEQYAQQAEATAISLFNNKIAAFTPALNASFARLRHEVPLDLYETLCGEFLRRVADCHVLTPGWRHEPAVRSRLRRATRLGKPSFETLEDVLSWHRGDTFAHVRLDK